MVGLTIEAVVIILLASAWSFPTGIDDIEDVVANDDGDGCLSPRPLEAPPCFFFLLLLVLTWEDFDEVFGANAVGFFRRYGLAITVGMVLQF